MLELSEEQLKQVLAGTNQNLSEEQALNNEDLFRKQKLEELKQEREDLKETLEEEQIKGK